MPTLRQAAVLLANLPADDAAALLAKLDPAEQQVIRGEMTRVEADLNELQSAVNTFSCDNRATAVANRKSLSELLQSVDHQTLLASLTSEHPQTIALVLGSLPRPRAVKLLGAFPAALQADLVRRIAGIIQPSPDIVREVAIGFLGRIRGAASRNSENRAA